MAILNYTTQISSEKTVTEIQRTLARAGTSAILTEYDSHGILCAISFRINVPSGLMSFRLPANVDNVLECLKRESKVPTRLKVKEQASRVAWRILKDWIEAQMAIVEADCAVLEQVFLPYAQTDQGKTVYEQIKDGGFLKLAAPKG